MDLNEIKDRLDTLAAAVKTSSTVQRIETYAERPVTLSWKVCGLITALFIAVFFLGRCDVERRVNQQWRDKLAASSSAVQEVMKNEQRDIDQLDSLILKALEQTHERLSAAEKELAKARNRQSPDGCPRIPSVCLRPGTGGG